MGPDEVAAGEVTVRDMGSHDENRVALSEAPAFLARALGYDVAGGCGCGDGCGDGCDCDRDGCDCGR